MKTINCKRVDLWDGGERHTFGFYISQDVDNKEIEKSHLHCVISNCLLTIFDSLDEKQQNTRQAYIKSAWAKLTDKEREALNILVEPK